MYKTMVNACHYTSISNLKNMLGYAETGYINIWASSAYEMDDQTEMNFGYPFIKSVIESYETNLDIGDNQIFTSILRPQEKYISGPDDKYYLPKSKTPFIISFTRAINDEKMWKEYGDDSKGVCLLFDSNMLVPPNNQFEKFLLDIAYINWNNLDLEIWYALAETIIRGIKIAHVFTPILKYSNDSLTLKTWILKKLCPVISASIKMEKYIDEQELRWIHIYDLEKSKTRKNFADRTIHYIEEQIPIDYLKGIMCGPKCFQQEEIRNFCYARHINFVTNNSLNDLKQ